MINQSDTISNHVLTRMQAALHLLKAVDGDNRKLVPLPVENNKQRSKVLLVSSFANIYSAFHVQYFDMPLSSHELLLYSILHCVEQRSQSDLWSIASMHSVTRSLHHSYIHNYEYLFQNCVSDYPLHILHLCCYHFLCTKILTAISSQRLGMGHTDDFTKFFNACAKFRDYGFRSFVGSLASFGMSWVCALLLTYDNDENELRWWVALPAILVAVMSFLHYKELFALASTFVYSG